MTLKFYFKLPLKKIIFTLSLLFAALFTQAQTIVWKNSVVGTSTSGNGRAPQSSHKYTRTVYFISAAEMAAGGIDAGKILKGIGFNYRPAEAIPTATASGNLKIYLQNTAATSYGKGTDWTTSITGMTKVSDAAATIPAAITADFMFSNGSSFTYSGDGVYVAFEWANPTIVVGTTANTAYCNSSTVSSGGSNGLFNAFSPTVIAPEPTTLASNNFRPATRFAFELPDNDVKVANIYALTNAPGVEAKQMISARISNEGANTQYNFNVTLNVTGANTFTSNKVVSFPVETGIASGSGLNIDFDEFIATNPGTNNITVTINGSDDNNLNNVASLTQVGLTGLFSYNKGLLSNTSGVGSTTNVNFMAVAKFTANGIVYPSASRFFIGTSTASVGQKLKAVWYNSDKVLMAESNLYTVTTGDLGTFVILNYNTTNTAVPTLSGSTDFYVGVGAVAATLPIYFIGRQDETPIRANTFFSGDIDAGTFTASSSKFMIESITKLSTLPVTISSFTAAANNNKVALKWSVGTENNVSRYEIERAQKDGAFVKVATVNAVGSSSYTTLDASPLTGDNYYRLKTLDNDGTHSYFGEIKVVKITDLVNNSFAIYPNPVTANEINISLTNYDNGKYNYQVVDMAGSVVQKGTISHTGDAKHTINLSSSIVKGTYIFSLSNGKEVSQSKFIKN